MRNDPTATALARQPRAIVKVGEVRLPDPIEVEVDNNNLYQADSFRAVLSLYKMPPDMDWAWWAQQTEIVVEIFMGFPDDPLNYTENDLKSYIVGRTDGIDIDPGRGEIVLVGRDFTSVLIDSKTTEKWPNAKSSAIATLIAERHDLIPVVTETSTLVGKYYELEHARMTRQDTEWDLLTYLAQEENFVVFVQGKELHFEPKPDTATVDPYVIVWNDQRNEQALLPGYSVVTVANVSRLRFSRNLTLANDVIVKVRSWNFAKAGGFTKEAKATHRKKGVLAGLPTPTGEAQVFVFDYPNLTPEQALQKAQALLAQITQHEIRIQGSLPGDDILTARDVVQVWGTETDYDTMYYPENVIRRMNMSDGYTMEIRAKNHATDSQALI